MKTKFLAFIFLCLSIPGFGSEFNVKDYGATGNGTTNDTVAIQSAMAALPVNGGVLLFPAGRYLVTSSLDFSGRQSFELRGDGIRSGGPQGTQIVGSISGDDVVKSIGSGSFFIHGIAFRNTSPSGRSALHVEGFTNGVVEFCQVASSGAYGLYAPQNTFSFMIRSVTFNGSNHVGIGLLASGHTSVDTCDITGWNEGIRAFGTTVNITACRIEVNNIGLNLGVKTDGTNWSLTRSFIAGNSFESNGIAIRANVVQA